MKSSFQLVSIAALAVMTYLPAKAALVAYEGFNYPSGTVLQGQINSNLFTAWKSDNASTPGYELVSGLSYGALNTNGNGLSGGYAYSTSGMKMDFATTTGWDAYKTSELNQWTGTDTMIGATGKTLYASLLMQNTGTPDWAGGTSFGFNTDNYNAVDPMYDGMVGLAVSVMQGGAVTLHTVSATGATWDVAPMAVQTAHASVTAGALNFYVLKIEFGASSDTVSLFVNPTPGAAEPESASAMIATSGNLVFRSMNLYGGTNPGESKFDEIRIGDTFQDVTTTVPEPSTYAAMAGLIILGLAWIRRRK